MNGLLHLSYLAIALTVFGQQLCLPLPSMLLLMTAGAFAERGEGHLAIPLVLLWSVVACLAADSVWFWLGRRWGNRVIRLICSLTSDPQGSQERTRRVFDRWGLKMLLVAKFIPVMDGVSPPLAGAHGATILGFLLYDTLGSMLWSSAYVLLGFFFSSAVHRVTELIDHFGKFIVVVVGVPFLAWTLSRIARLTTMIRHLRLHTISPALLQQRLDDGEKVGVIDLLRYEAMNEEIPGIAGAVRIDPKLLKSGEPVVVPDGVAMVLYCSSKNELTSARVAEAMKKVGLTNVWILEGGLDAWIAEGRPTTTNFVTREELATRLGIVLPPPLTRRAHDGI